MSTYKNGMQTKKQLIACTYTALLSHNASELKIRDLAKQAGCSISSVYQQFTNLDELIAVSSVKFLDEYATEYSEMLSANHDIADSYLQGWELFCKHAFNRPDIFYRLFWDLHTIDLEEAVTQYYGLFPLTPPEEYSIQYYLTFLTGDVVERDYVLMRTMTSQGLVTAEDAHYVSTVVTSMARTFLADCRRADEKKRNESRKQCMDLVRYTLKLALDRHRLIKEKSSQK